MPNPALILAYHSANVSGTQYQDKEHVALALTCIDSTAHKANQCDRFLQIDTLAECEAEIRQASAYIAQLSARKLRHLAYP